jgi:hypothetical protein
MTTRTQIAGCLAAAVLGVVGCRTPKPATPVPPPRPPAPAPDLPATKPVPVEPDYRTLPATDPLGKLGSPFESTFRALSEEECRRSAVAHTALADVLEGENDVPPPATPTCRHPHKKDPEAAKAAAVDALLRELRAHAAEEARNRSAADALEQFFRLADAEGRGELLRAMVPTLDRLREAVVKARATGVRVPVEADELDRQRASFAGTLAQADLGVELLNIDLKRRTGLPAGGDRLWPTGSFAVTDAPVDAEAAVQVALANRPDLKFLRAAYLGLTPDTLPTVQEILRTKATDVAGRSGPAQAAAKGLLPYLSHSGAKCDPNAAAELEVRRRQLYTLIADRERAAADETRAAAAMLVAQGKQVALARWRADQANAKLPDAKKAGPFVELPAILEAQRGRADVIAAVMAWHQARIKLAAAQGLLAGGTPESPK